jgi:hypothetical protein
MITPSASTNNKNNNNISHNRKYNTFRFLHILLLYTFFILIQQQHVKYYPIRSVITGVNGFIVRCSSSRTITTSYQQHALFLVQRHITGSNVRTFLQRRKQQQQQQHHPLLQQQQINVQQDDLYTIDTLPINGNSGTLLPVPTTSTTSTLQQEQQQQFPLLQEYNTNHQNNHKLTKNNNNSNKNKTKMIVIMNENARGVSKSTIQIAQSIFGNEHVYVTKSIHDVYNTLYTIIMDSIVQQQQSNDNNSNSNSIDLTTTIKDNMVIIPIGGDGTLATTIQTLCQILYTIQKKQQKQKQKQQQQQFVSKNNMNNDTETNIDNDTTSSTTDSDTDTGYTSMISQLPIIAYVPLGTGNAVGSVVGCQYTTYNNIQQQQQLLVSNRNRTSTTTSKNSFRTAISSIPKRLYHKVQTIYHRCTTGTGIESKSIHRLRSILTNIRETIHQYDSKNTQSNEKVVLVPLPIIELPMIEISTTTNHPKNLYPNDTTKVQSQQSSITDLCFFAGGM